MTDTLTLDAPHIVSRWKRLLYSFLSALIAWTVVTAAASASLVHYAFLDWFGAFAMWFVIGGIFCLPGWFLSLPIVLTVNHFERSRFWIFLGIGAAFGPFVLVVEEMYFRLEEAFTHASVGTLAPGYSYFIYLSACVSLLTTLIYLLLIRRAQRVKK